MFQRSFSLFSLIVMACACGGGGGGASTDASSGTGSSSGSAAGTTTSTGGTSTDTSTSDSGNSSTEPCSAALFSAPSIGSAYVDRVQVAYDKSCAYFGDISPMEMWLTSNIESEAQALRDQWCSYRQEQDSGFLAAWCANSQIGVGLANYVFWSDVGYEGLNTDHHQLNLSVFSEDNADDLSAEYVTIHEYFHAYQYSHLDKAIYSTNQQRDINMGRSADSSRPWFSEGTANYMGHYLTAVEYRSDHLRNELGYYLDSCENLFNSDFDVRALQYDDNCAYEIATWSAAYLVHTSSLDTMWAFFDDLNDYGFVDAFEKNFGENPTQFSTTFTGWLTSTSDEEKLAIVPTP